MKPEESARKSCIARANGKEGKYDGELRRIGEPGRAESRHPASCPRRATPIQATEPGFRSTGVPSTVWRASSTSITGIPSRMG